MRKDGITVIGARCTDDDCDWGPLGTDRPESWDIVERMRLEHEEDTGHTVTVEAVEQKTILVGSWGMGEAGIDMAIEAGVGIEWVYPECEKTAEKLDAGKNCPNCDEPFREAWP